MGENEKKRLFLVFFAKNIWFFAKIPLPLHPKSCNCLYFDSIQKCSFMFFIGLLAQLVRATDS